MADEERIDEAIDRLQQVIRLLGERQGFSIDESRCCRGWRCSISSLSS